MIDSNADKFAILKDFGVDVTYNGSTFKGIFDNEYEGVEVGAEVPFAMQTIRLTARTSDLPGVDYASQLTISGVTYDVAVVMPDGQGMTVLQLEKA